jgi:D-sedoheptulose 7-phosphate isomerase
MTLASYLGESGEVLRATSTPTIAEQCEKAIALIVRALSAGKPVMVCGNGGSACDAMHITGELVGRFLSERRSFNVLCLSSNPAVLTAWSNDYAFDTVFARQVEAHAESGGVLWGLSTSGCSVNVVKAFEQARRRDMCTIAMTGEGGGALAAISDVTIAVPSKRTPLIQQVHICLYHYICESVERQLVECSV